MQQGTSANTWAAPLPPPTGVVFARIVCVRNTRILYDAAGKGSRGRAYDIMICARGVQRSRPAALKDPFTRLVVLGPAAAAECWKEMYATREIYYKREREREAEIHRLCVCVCV